MGEKGYLVNIVKTDGIKAVLCPMVSQRRNE